MGQSCNAAMIPRVSAYGLIKTTKNAKIISTVSSKLSCLSLLNVCSGYTVYK